MRSILLAGAAATLSASLAVAQSAWQPYDDGSAASARDQPAAAAAPESAERPPLPAPPPAPLPAPLDAAAPLPPPLPAPTPSPEQASAPERTAPPPTAPEGPAPAPAALDSAIAPTAGAAATATPAAASKAAEAPEPCKDSESRSAEGPSGSRSGFTGSASDLTRPTGPGFSGGAGFGSLAKDVYATVSLATSFTLGPVSLGVQAPLRFRVYDLAQNKAYFQLRKEDWDEPADYLRILRFVELNKPKDTVYARLGELTGTTLGHGTIVSSYYNSTDIDHFESGARVNVNLAFGGVETLLNNLASPRLAGVRAYARPWHFVDCCSALCRLAVGASAFVDGAAPQTMEGATVDSVNQIHTRTKPLGVYGLDAEFDALSNALLDLTPYTDLNFIGGEGAGWHAGALFGIHPSVISAQVRFEFRRMGARYLPAYFDALYEIQRFSYLNGKTKLQSLDEGGSGQARSGYYGELVVGFGSALSVMGSYEDYQGPNNSSLQLQVVLPTVAGLKVGAYYIKRNFDRFAQVFDPVGAMGIFEARYALYPFMALVAQASRQWQVDSDGSFHAVDSFHVGVDFNVQF